MLVGLGTTVVGIGVMLVILIKERRRSLQMLSLPSASETT
jgi:hypothetical protein